MVRTITSLLLALVMAATSLSLAAARAQADQPVEAMVICNGMGITTVLIGADGAPVTSHHVCPDGLVGLDLPAPVLAPTPPTTTLIAHLSGSALTRAAPVTPVAAPQARAPPLTV